MDVTRRARPRRPGRADRSAGRRVGVAAGTCAAATGALLVVAGPGASAAAPGTVTAGVAVERSCFERAVPGAAGVATSEVTAAATGLVRARLRAAGDWDLGVFDRATGRSVAAAAGFGGDELAEGFVTAGQRLLVQACRYAGPSATASLAVDVLASPPRSGEVVQLVEVSTPAPEDERRLSALGLDLTEHGGAASIEVVLHGAADVERLRSTGFTWTVRIPDLAARAEANRLEDERYAATERRSALPSGRTTYRRLADYDLEMKRLAARHPWLVRPITLRYRTHEGRDVHGIEITRNAADVADGKPVFLTMGVHHAREWPSSEHALEFAYDLIGNYAGDAEVHRLVDTTRTIVVPVVNPDGFNVSREAPRIGDFSLFDYEMKRKNCNRADAPLRFRGGSCDDNPAGRLRGVDPNRNYAGFWGGPGASPEWSSDLYRGSGPFSEPETQNIRELVSTRQVTNLISNHTYSNLVLHPPGQFDTQPSLDEPTLAALGGRMTAHNDYANIQSRYLYETTGTTEDWSFWNTGGLGYTFEIGPEEFHPPFYRGVVAEYVGLAPAAGAGRGGNRAAYLEMLRATADRALHSTLTGTAPPGHTLRVHKEFSTPTSPVIGLDGSVGRPIRYRDVLDSTFGTRSGGSFSWAVNPSTRPYVAGRLGRDPVAPPQADLRLANPPGVPAENQGDPLTGPAERVPFTVQGPPRADNGRFTVHIEWGDAAVDWDLYVVNAAGEVVASSAEFGDATEDAVLLDPPPGRYTAVVVNYDGGTTSDWRAGAVRFRGPEPTVVGSREAWTLTCEGPGGAVRTVRRVVVDRGATARLGEVCGPTAKQRAAG